MGAIHRQTEPDRSGEPVSSDHVFTIRPESSTTVSSLADSSLVDYEGQSTIAEFKKFEPKDAGQAITELSLLTDQIQSPSVRSFILDSLRISREPHFTYPQVRAKAIEALIAFSSDPDVQIVCAQEFRRQIDQELPCKAAFELLSKVELRNDSSPKIACAELVKEKLGLLAQREVSPGVLYALRYLGKDIPKMVEQSVIKAATKALDLKEPNLEVLEGLAKLGTARSVKLLCDIAQSNIRSKFDLEAAADNNRCSCGSNLNHIQIAWGLVGGLMVAGIVGALSHSAGAAFGTGIGVFLGTVFLPVFLPATLTAIFDKTEIRSEMRSKAIELLASQLPNQAAEDCIVSVCLEPKDLKFERAGVLEKLSRTTRDETIKNVITIIRTGNDFDRLEFLRAFANHPDPALRQAIVALKSDRSMLISEEATRIAINW